MNFIIDFRNGGQQKLEWDANQDIPNPASLILDLTFNKAKDAEVRFDIKTNDSVKQWIILSGSAIAGNVISIPESNYMGAGIEIAQVSRTLHLSLDNISNLPNGEYTTELKFECFSKYNTNGNYILTDSDSYIITLSISNNESVIIKVDKEEYNVFFNRTTGELSGEKSVLIFNNSKPNLLNFKSEYFLEKNGFTDHFDLNIANIGMGSDLPINGLVKVIGGVFLENLRRIANVMINLYIGENEKIFSDKNQISFTITKSNNEKDFKRFYLMNPGNKSFTITSPSWLNLSVISGNSSIYISATTVSPFEIPGGNYRGEIKISYGSNQLIISVALKVIDFFIYPINSLPGFCLDVPGIEFNKTHDLAKFVKTTINTTFNLKGVEYLKEDVYIVPYINEQCSISIGEITQKKFPRFKDHFFEIDEEIELMRAAKISLKAEEMDLSYRVLRSFTAPEIKLFPGRKKNAYPLLSNHFHRKKNPGTLFINSRIKDDRILVRKIDDTKNINELVFDSAIIKYYDYPQYKNILNFHFENDNYSPEWFSFTGEYKISTEYNHIYAKNIFKNQNEKFDFSKVKSLILNSGYFLKDEINLLSKIIESKLVFIKIENKVYRCFSTTQKLITEDSSEELPNRDLEFLIVE
ncbi:Uncharacterised protein [Chryseobacterium nakagawai]|uniref:Uncharacterized protein n=1 Tax=Chryseobacterium nakagawai TaxID=1241982 RepID=A0AAD0YQ85_CHRNA|nr:hypothetical protein [Chryseobacterium nakagawai]AZA93055.1 hypothetical protein EG343_21845 [Chryseobacterium nakagawai]VEH19688.1 Uncharacterised protein [Chryseobacterium nakagawai]